jgi:hypothetical protein
LKKDSITAIFVSLPYEGYPEISSGSFDASGDEALKDAFHIERG